MKTVSKNRAVAWAVTAAFGGIIVGQVAPIKAQNIGDILKGAVIGGGVLLVVDKFGGDINKFVNTITGNKPGSDSGEGTKVVPILSVGRGTYAGAVQVSGPKANVERVRAVAQLEGQARIGADIRARVLIPIADRSVSNAKSLSRVKGVGVSTLIDVKL